MPELSDATRAKIERHLGSASVVLFMKGKRRSPQCGFSASVVELLDGWLDDYTTVDVLADPELREGIKSYADWPTIPQLYVEREFIGGADIVRELEDSGELPGALGVDPEALEPPEITITDAALEQFQTAFDSPELGADDHLRLTIDGRFRNDLSIGPRRPHDVAVRCGPLELLLDRRSARRANGLSIDYLETREGAGFKIDNPNAPPEVREIHVQELAQRLAKAKAAGEALHIYDVRTESERELASLEDAVLLDDEAADAIEALPRDTPLYFMCHHGVRSLRAAQHFLHEGFVEVYNVVGGIDAWSREVDESVPRY